MINKHNYVCIQGLGYVGAAMAIAVASARNPDGSPAFQVTGVDQSTDLGQARVDALNQGIFPFPTADEALKSALIVAKETGNLIATTDESVYAAAGVIVVDVPLDISYLDDNPKLQMPKFETAIRAVGQQISAGALLLIETTVPPGTCEKIVVPVMQDVLKRRGLDKDAVYIAHSPERVMPGEGYLTSIVNYWRPYAGQTDIAADVCEKFLSKVINVEHFPLSRLSSLTASETTKVMENTYRAVNIAFIDEWTKYSEALGIDLYEVVEAIRVRPTHSNIRFPGLGVGGYCLTKDPTFAPAGAKQLFGLEALDFPFSRLAVEVNQDMPLHAVERLTRLLVNGCVEKKILVLGLSYREGIGDTRYSPTEILVRALQSRGAYVSGYDPFLTQWAEMNWSLPTELPSPVGLDAVIFGTAHQQFRKLDLRRWLGVNRPILLDTVNVVTVEQRQLCREAGIRFESVGRGDGL